MMDMVMGMVMGMVMDMGEEFEYWRLHLVSNTE